MSIVRPNCKNSVSTCYVSIFNKCESSLSFGAINHTKLFKIRAETAQDRKHGNLRFTEPHLILRNEFKLCVRLSLCLAQLRSFSLIFERHTSLHADSTVYNTDVNKLSSSLNDKKSLTRNAMQRKNNGS